MGDREILVGKQIITGQETDAGTEKKGTGRTAGRNRIEEKSGSLTKVRTRLKERRDMLYDRAMEMWRRY